MLMEKVGMQVLGNIDITNLLVEEQERKVLAFCQLNHGIGWFFGVSAKLDAKARCAGVNKLTQEGEA
ncbi:hypothetical protein D3C84_1056260 [compost metagenome]